MVDRYDFFTRFCGSEIIVSHGNLQVQDSKLFSQYLKHVLHPKYSAQGIFQLLMDLHLVFFISFQDRGLEIVSSN
jgi:hypothetical protein